MANILSPVIKRQVEQGIAVLKKGGLVAYPTDTVYGLGASAWLDRAVEKIFEVKQRSRNLALPLLLANASQIEEVASPVPEIAWRLIKAFMPGGLTIVLSKTSRVSDLITAGQNKVAIRIPNHPVPIALIKGLGAPLVGTSANISGLPSLLTAAEVKTQLGDKIDLVIDGACPGGKESTIVDVTAETPVILREGTISGIMIKHITDVI